MLMVCRGSVNAPTISARYSTRWIRYVVEKKNACTLIYQHVRTGVCIQQGILYTAVSHACMVLRRRQRP